MSCPQRTSSLRKDLCDASSVAQALPVLPPVCGRNAGFFVGKQIQGRSLPNVQHKPGISNFGLTKQPPTIQIYEQRSGLWNVLRIAFLCGIRCATSSRRHVFAECLDCSNVMCIHPGEPIMYGTPKIGTNRPCTINRRNGSLGVFRTHGNFLITYMISLDGDNTHAHELQDYAPIPHNYFGFPICTTSSSCTFAVCSV